MLCGCSGGWRDVHVESEGLGASVVVAGITFQRERDGGQEMIAAVPF
jgi:hypothetical protein